MWQFLLKTLIAELIKAGTQVLSDWIQLMKKRKENKKKVDNAINEKDPKKRAKNISRLLGGK